LPIKSPSEHRDLRFNVRRRHHWVFSSQA
jgi:hypothetical protein